MNSDKPLVSVFMITYNHEKYIAQAIESALMQKTDFNYEIVIGEDCSTDRTREIVVDYANRYPEIIKPILHENNVGAKANSESVRKACIGKYVAILEGDDYWIDPLKLQKQVDFMESHPDFSMCCHAVEVLSCEETRRKRVIRTCKSDKVIPPNVVFASGGRIIGTNSILFRRRLSQDPPSFIKNSTLAGDFLLVLNLSLCGKLYYLDQIMSVYRQHVPESWSARMGKSREKRISYYSDKIDFYEQLNRYTNRRFEESIETAKNRNEILLLLEKGKFSSVKKKKYHKALQSFGFAFLLRQRLKRNFPKTTDLLKALLRCNEH